MVTLLLPPWTIMACSVLNLPFAIEKNETLLLSYIMQRTAVLVITVLTADSSGRTALR